MQTEQLRRARNLSGLRATIVMQPVFLQVSHRSLQAPTKPPLQPLLHSSKSAIVPASVNQPPAAIPSHRRWCCWTSWRPHGRWWCMCCWRAAPCSRCWSTTTQVTFVDVITMCVQSHQPVTTKPGSGVRAAGGQCAARGARTSRVSRKLSDSVPHPAQEHATVFRLSCHPGRCRRAFKVRAAAPAGSRYILFQYPVQHVQRMSISDLPLPGVFESLESEEGATLVRRGVGQAAAAAPRSGSVVASAAAAAAAAPL